MKAASTSGEVINLLIINLNVSNKKNCTSLVVHLPDFF